MVCAFGAELGAWRLEFRVEDVLGLRARVWVAEGNMALPPNSFVMPPSITLGESAPERRVFLRVYTSDKQLLVVFGLSRWNVALGACRSSFTPGVRNLASGSWGIMVCSNRSPRTGADTVGASVILTNSMFTYS